jgi:hypothetical protein
MFPGRLDLVLGRDRRRELMRAARRADHLDPSDSPVSRVTLRYAALADRDQLRRLAELDSATAPAGETLVAEVDGRLRAAMPLDGSQPIADPFHRGVELLELLRLRAAQLKVS